VDYFFRILPFHQPELVRQQLAADRQLVTETVLSQDLGRALLSPALDQLFQVFAASMMCRQTAWAAASGFRSGIPREVPVRLAALRRSRVTIKWSLVYRSHCMFRVFRNDNITERLAGAYNAE